MNQPDIIEFCKLINVKNTNSVSYNKDIEYVSFTYDIIITENIIQKTKEFFKFDNFAIIDHSIYKIPSEDTIAEIFKLFEICKIDFANRKISIPWNSIDLTEITSLKNILKCENLRILSNGLDDNSYLEIKWT